MSQKIKTTNRRKRPSVGRIVRQIADELLSVNYGQTSWEMGDRLAVKKADGVLERELGGRNRKSIEDVLTRHLLSAGTERPEAAALGARTGGKP